MVGVIRCEVVKVDETATTCQKVGNAFLVDERMEEKVCPKARVLVHAAADRMKAGGEQVRDEVDVPCPDHYVVYRLSFVDSDEMA